MTAVAMTIAGSDPSGGAGLQADLKTFHQHGVYGCSAVTLLTVQNSLGVKRVEKLAPDLVREQIEAVCEDLDPRAAKTGALGSVDIIEVVAEAATNFPFPLVVDPVMISKHGHPLMDEQAVEALKGRLLPKAFLTTPNVFEAERLTDRSIADWDDLESAARIIAELGVHNVLIKGPVMDSGRSDLLLLRSGEVKRFSTPDIETANTHGSGCVFSAAITARLACGASLVAAVEHAKHFISAAIASGPELGRGVGPVNMHADVMSKR